MKGFDYGMVNEGKKFIVHRYNEEYAAKSKAVASREMIKFAICIALCIISAILFLYFNANQYSFIVLILALLAHIIQSLRLSTVYTNAAVSCLIEHGEELFYLTMKKGHSLPKNDESLRKLFLEHRRKAANGTEDENSELKIFKVITKNSGAYRKKFTVVGAISEVGKERDIIIPQSFPGFYEKETA